MPSSHLAGFLKKKSLELSETSRWEWLGSEGGNMGRESREGVGGKTLLTDSVSTFVSQLLKHYT